MCATTPGLQLFFLRSFLIKKKGYLRGKGAEWSGFREKVLPLNVAQYRNGLRAEQVPWSQVSRTAV